MTFKEVWHTDFYSLPDEETFPVPIAYLYRKTKKIKEDTGTQCFYGYIINDFLVKNYSLKEFKVPCYHCPFRIIKKFDGRFIVSNTCFMEPFTHARRILLKETVKRFPDIILDKERGGSF